MVKAYSEHNGNLHLKIESKKLLSGKCQVKFYVNGVGLKSLYGYTLVEPDRTLKDVILELKDKLAGINGYENFCQGHLFSIRRSSRSFDGHFMIFKN